MNLGERLITREEWTRINGLKPFIHYTKEEKQFILNLAREFADPNLTDSCASCTGGGDAKLKLYGWFNDRKDALLEAIEQAEKPEEKEESLVEPSEFEKAQKEVELYVEKTCACGNKLKGNQKKYCSKECKK